MRDKRFVAVHRGGPLKKEEHYQLIEWACRCAEHVLPLLGAKIDERLLNALTVAKAWSLGKASVGETRKASVGAHTVAREADDPTATAVARSVGHAVATAHMADHSLGAALYALKAVNSVGGSVESEKKWQVDQLPQDVKELVMTAMVKKEKHFRL